MVATGCIPIKDTNPTWYIYMYYYNIHHLPHHSHCHCLNWTAMCYRHCVLRSYFVISLVCHTCCRKLRSHGQQHFAFQTTTHHICDMFANCVSAWLIVIAITWIQYRRLQQQSYDVIPSDYHISKLLATAMVLHTCPHLAFPDYLSYRDVGNFIILSVLQRFLMSVWICTVLHLAWWWWRYDAWTVLHTPSTCHNSKPMTTRLVINITRWLIDATECAKQSNVIAAAEFRNNYIHKTQLAWKIISPHCRYMIRIMFLHTAVWILSADPVSLFAPGHLQPVPRMIACTKRKDNCTNHTHLSL